jgi:uncharacterized cofD-like protein
VNRPLRVVALGGGHGLAASLSALQHVQVDGPPPEITAVVTVADDGGSSGRLRAEHGVIAPGDLRMAMAALCDDGDQGQMWREVLQHRFRRGEGLAEHAVGNLLMLALWELRPGDVVAGLDALGGMVGLRGRVLPMSREPLDIEATLAPDGAEEDSDAAAGRTVRGQVAVATAPGRISRVRLHPDEPTACPEAVAAVRAADWVVLGPGSWYTSVLPHLLVPELRRALETTDAGRLVTLNLAAQQGETTGFAPWTHLEVLASYAPDLRVDVVLADERPREAVRLRAASAALGAELVLAPVAAKDGTPAHDEPALARAYGEILRRGRIGTWR